MKQAATSEVRKVPHDLLFHAILLINHDVGSPILNFELYFEARLGPRELTSMP